VLLLGIAVTIVERFAGVDARDGGEGAPVAEIRAYWA
jgi:hypothetical protein